MRFQVDQEFQQVKIKDINDLLNNAEMFSTFLRGGKAFAAEQKIRELTTRIAKLFSQKLKSPRKIIEKSTANVNIQPKKKNVFSPEEVEERSLESERFRTVYKIHRLEKTHRFNLSQDSYEV